MHWYFCPVMLLLGYFLLSFLEPLLFQLFVLLLHDIFHLFGGMRKFFSFFILSSDKKRGRGGGRRGGGECDRDHCDVVNRPPHHPHRWYIIIEIRDTDCACFYHFNLLHKLSCPEILKPPVFFNLILGGRISKLQFKQ